MNTFFDANYFHKVLKSEEFSTSTKIGIIFKGLKFSTKYIPLSNDVSRLEELERCQKIKVKKHILNFKNLDEMKNMIFFADFFVNFKREEGVISNAGSSKTASSNVFWSRKT